MQQNILQLKSPGREYVANNTWSWKLHWFLLTNWLSQSVHPNNPLSVKHWKTFAGLFAKTFSKKSFWGTSYLYNGGMISLISNENYRLQFLKVFNLFPAILQYTKKNWNKGEHWVRDWNNKMIKKVLKIHPILF